MRVRGAVACGVVCILHGCVYYNSIYNAERLLEEGEALHRAGLDSLAVLRYREVIRKASGGFRQEPDGEWSGQALLLLGRAHLRLGDLRAAGLALQQATAPGIRPEVRARAELFLGAVMVESGDVVAAVSLLDHALTGVQRPVLRAEAHLWRGRARLGAGDVAGGWTDLEEAASLDSDVRLPAELEVIRSGIALGEEARVRGGVARVLALPEGGGVADTLAAMLVTAADRWGAPFALSLLEGLDSTAWAPGPRGRIRIARAEFLSSLGDTATESAELRRVARGRGAAAVTARVRLARKQLAAAQDLRDARAALPLLLPASDDARAATLIEAFEEVQALAEMGLGEPLGWFAAAEAARDRLGAGDLARGLYLAYADAAPQEPWSAKALLAALAMTHDEGGRAWLRGRLEGRASSPYVLAARGEPAPGLEELEEELALRLQGIHAH